MNPLTKVKLINELNAREAELGVQEAVSWHAEYKDSAWIFVGGLHYELTEGDVICVFSQYGEIVNINLVRDKKTGKSKGFCFLCYEDQRSTILAVDNFNGIKIKGRTIRVDHVANYRPPKESEDWDEVTRALHAKGCGVKTPPHTSSDSPSEDEDVPVKKQKEKQRSRAERSKSSPQAGKRVSTEEPHPRIRIKKEKEDPGYERYAGGSGDRNAGSRTQREEEQRRHQRHSDRRGDKNCHQQRGHSGSWEEREKKDEAGRRGDGRSGRQDASPRGSKSREPHSRHRERGSGRDSGRC
ncbi:PREDICTED: RNA-binding motif protein, X-linked 2 isoform X1 [Pseudopodoces humilis]|uniref:RNA-binding motif protein, X-linked 2 isoform X1 n=1 Tax=Pseudopodoces humilis TaxID=181119 RepID=UPI0006B70F1B|nr:PREDICTED: RNA-binding motif protein, X-linked 2 isoform X1 [Pseudopodoces humilis]